jgi:thioredoxin-like negative regulator of GroEL
VAVDVSNDVVRTGEFYDGYGFTIPAGFDVEGSVARQFGVEATPTNYLLDGDGRVVWRHYGFRPGDEEALRREISAVLDSN